MNRYPLWKYLFVAIMLLISIIYTLPNFFGEVPAVQVSPLKTTAKIDTSVMQAVEQALKSASITSDGIFTDPNSIKVRFRDTDTQLKAKDVLDRALNPVADNPSFILALNLISDSPSWFTAINALPMYLGLDLRGGIHFLLQVDMNAAKAKRLDGQMGFIRNTLRDKFTRIEEDVHLIVSLQRANLENATQARFECDPTGRCIWVNESLCALFGQSVNTMVDTDGNGWLRSIEEANDVFHDWSEAVKNKTPYQREYTVRNQRTNKRTKCRAVGIPMFGKDGTTVRVWNGSVNPIEELA